MSLNETPMTRWYWREVLKKGTLIEEYVAVERAEDDSNAPRFMDGLVIMDGPFEISDDVRRDITGKDVVVIQSKNKRLGMYLMGQAFFSAHLMMKFKPRTIQSVALCRENDAILGPIFESYPNMKVVICPEDVWGPES